MSHPTNEQGNYASKQASSLLYQSARDAKAQRANEPWPTWALILVTVVCVLVMVGGYYAVWILAASSALSGVNPG
jgi:hypothetical protein